MADSDGLPAQASGRCELFDAGDQCLPARQAGLIECTIKHLKQTSNPGSLNEYNAVSYVWDPADVLLDVLIDSVPFKMC
jgi:hypothetical protein